MVRVLTFTKLLCEIANYKKMQIRGSWVNAIRGSILYKRETELTAHNRKDER